MATAILKQYLITVACAVQPKAVILAPSFLLMQYVWDYRKQSRGTGRSPTPADYTSELLIPNSVYTTRSRLN